MCNIPKKKKKKDQGRMCLLVYMLCVCPANVKIVAVLKLCMKQYAGTKCTLDYAHGCKKTASLVVFPYKTKSKIV